MRQAVLLLALVSVALGGCDRAGVSGAGAMRVEVEVYKGPLTQSPESQIGELSALLAETVKAALAWKEQAEALGCGTLPDAECRVLNQTIAGAKEVVAAICQAAPDDGNASGYYVEWRSSSADASDACSGYRKDKRASVTRLADTRVRSPLEAIDIIDASGEYARRVSTIAAMMRVKAFRVADSNIGFVPQNPQVRNLTAGYAFMLAELANMIATRTAILQKVFENCTPLDANGAPLRLSTSNRAQYEQAYRERRRVDECRFGNEKLPTSDYLRDVAPARFIDAYEWFNAASSSEGTDAYKLEDRVRAIRALTNDYHWEKVNEVYASGQGDVSMAFIKDELGNWNLKSYTNDPSKLLAAYRKGANALISAAVSVARKASGDPIQVAKGIGLLDLADRFATGKSPADASLGGLDITTLHERTAARLEAIRARFQDRTGKLDTAIPTAKTAVSDAVAVAARDAAALEEARRQRDADDAALNACTTDCGAAAAAAVASRGSVTTKELAAASSAQALREKQDELAVLQAERKQLAGVAAEEGQRILEEHQRDLLTLQTAVTSAAN